MITAGNSRQSWQRLKKLTTVDNRRQQLTTVDNSWHLVQLTTVDNSWQQRTMHGYNAYNSYSVQPEVYTSASYGLPSLHNVTVVTQQPGSSLTQGQPQNVRDWSSGLCGCCEDCWSCEYWKVDCTCNRNPHTVNALVQWPVYGWAGLLTH